MGEFFSKKFFGEVACEVFRKLPFGSLKLGGGVKADQGFGVPAPLDFLGPLGYLFGPGVRVLLPFPFPPITPRGRRITYQQCKKDSSCAL